METKANYVLIGLFALLGLIGSFVFLLWFAKIDLEKQYAYYDLLFENVSGLGMAGGVRYNGLPVGQVVMLELDADDPSLVRVRIEVNADTPVKTDTIAKLQSMGVTGVSFVALSGGSSEAARMVQYGVIETERSALQTLFEGAPELMEKAIALLEDLRDVVSDENTQAVSDMLGNLASASGRLDHALAEFDALSDDLGLAAREIAGFTGKLELLSETAEVTLNEATQTLVSIRGAAENTQGTLENAQVAFATADDLMQGELKDFIARGADAAAALETIVNVLEPSALATLDAARGLVEDRVPGLVDQLQSTAEVLEAQIAALSTDASALMSRYEAVGAQVQARVAQSETAIAAIEGAASEATGTLEAVRIVSQTAEQVLQSDIKPLANEATETLASVRDLTTEKLAPLIDQTQTTLATIDREATALAGSGREMLAQATARLREAQGTLQAFGVTLGHSDEMLTSLNTTADSLNTLVRGDGTALVADARAAAESAREALESINDTVDSELAALMQEVRDAAQTANRVLDSVGSNVSDASTHWGELSTQSRAAMVTATEAFVNANETLAAITDAMDVAQGTLGTAEQTFSAANRIMDEDIDVIMTDIRHAVGAFSTTVTNVSGDIDLAANEVLNASKSASSLVGTIDDIVQQNQRQVSDFLRLGLPQFRRFIEESRYLVGNLDSLVARIKRDPARFLLGTQGSEFRR